MTADYDRALRPKTFDDYVGQVRAKERAAVACRAARARGEPLPHTILEGPPGMGKTTLAEILAREMGGRLHQLNAVSLSTPDELFGLFLKVGRGDVLFIDEIHALNTKTCEYLYTAMEDFRLDVLCNAGTPLAEVVPYRLPPYTLVGGTTNGGDLPEPFRARFRLQLSLDWYTTDELYDVLAANCRKLKLDYVPAALAALAERSRGTPRVAVRLLYAARDYAELAGGTLAPEAVRRAMEAEGVDGAGLADLDRRYLRCLAENFGGGPAGLSGVAASLGRSVRELEAVVEPYLLRAGFVVRTSRGRKVTPLAYQHLGIEAKNG